MKEGYVHNTSLTSLKTSLVNTWQKLKMSCIYFSNYVICRVFIYLFNNAWQTASIIWRNVKATARTQSKTLQTKTSWHIITNMVKCSKHLGVTWRFYSPGSWEDTISILQHPPILHATVQNFVARMTW